MHLNGLKQRFNEGALTVARIVASNINGYWQVVVTDEIHGAITLACSQSHYPCLFSSLDEASAAIRDIGFFRFEVVRSEQAVPA